MTTLCHNCRNSVPEGAAFCPECGAPQLRVPGPGTRGPEEAAEAAEAVPQHTGEIVWPAAVRSAAVCAVPAGLLLSFLAVPLIDMLWIVMGAVWTLRRYRKHVPKAPTLTPQLGGRIGLVLGLFAAIVTTTANTLSLLLERYVLHQGAAMDAQLQKELLEGLERAQAFYPNNTAQSTAYFHFLLTPEGRGSQLLLSSAISVLAMLFFAWLGGRYAVRYGAWRPKRA